MPLEHGPPSGAVYLRRVRVAVDPEERDRGRSADQFDFVVPLREPLQNVVSIELVDYNVRQTLQTTFRDGVNNRADVYMEDTATGLQTLSFTVSFSEYVRDAQRSATTLAAQLTSELNEQMDAQGHAYFNTGNTVVWTVSVLAAANARGVSQALLFTVEEGAVADTVIARFLFGSGASRVASAAPVLGFADEDTDVFAAGGTTYYTPVPGFLPQVTPDRYLDVFVEQAPELAPVARVFLTDDANFERQRGAVKRARFLVDPIRRLDQLRVRLTLPDGSRPVAPLAAGVDLVFELLAVAAEDSLPPWLQQGVSM
jgi:hypothetical protein